jgi:hypothetical protein
VLRLPCEWNECYSYASESSASDSEGEESFASRSVIKLATFALNIANIPYIHKDDGYSIA